MIQPSRTTKVVLFVIALGVAALALRRAGLLANFASWGFLLLCPLMHIAMMAFMGGHGSHGKGHGPSDEASEPNQKIRSCH